MAKIIKRSIRVNPETDKELDNIIRQVPHKDDVLAKNGLTKTVSFYGFSDSSHTISAELVLTVKEGQITKLEIKT